MTAPSHSTTPPSSKQKRLMSKLASERATTYTTDDLHCSKCAGRWISKTLRRRR